MFTAPRANATNNIDPSEVKLRVVPPSRRLYRLGLYTLDLPQSVKRAARSLGIVMSMDDFRETFTGERNHILTLIQKHLAPNDPAKQRELVRQMIEA